MVRLFTPGTHAGQFTTMNGYSLGLNLAQYTEGLQYGLTHCLDL